MYKRQWFWLFITFSHHFILKPKILFVISISTFLRIQFLTYIKFGIIFIQPISYVYLIICDTFLIIELNLSTNLWVKSVNSYSFTKHTEFIPLYINIKKSVLPLNQINCQLYNQWGYLIPIISFLTQRC